MEAVVISLIVFLIVQQVIYLVTIHRLVNKIMAGNYSEYVLANKQAKAKEPQKMRVDVGPDEDLGVLNEYMPIP